MVGFIDFIIHILDFIIEPFILFLEIKDCSLNGGAFSSLIIKLSFNFIEFFFLEVAVSTHLFDDSLEFFAFSFELFGVFLIFLYFRLLRLSLLSEPLIFLFHLS